jgi:hypothetical protein
MIDIKVDTKDVERMLGDLSRKMPSTVARALTKTAFDARDQVKGWLPRLLDRPTPWTMRSLFVFPAEKDDLRSAVAFKHELGRLPRSAMDRVTAASSMRAQVFGGDRALKASEKTLLSNGITSRARPYLIPAKGARLDKYGNVTGAFMNKVLFTGVARGSASQGYHLPLDRSARRGRPSHFFVMYRGGQAVGIYKRTGRGGHGRPLPVFLFSATANYRSRVPFNNIVEKYVARQLPKRIEESIDVVLRKYGA